MMKFNKKNAIAITFLIIISSVFYALTIRGIAGNLSDTDLKNQQSATQPFELSPERGRFAHVMALAEDKTYALDRQKADFVYPDVGYWAGKFYSYFAPGMAYLALPFYLLGMYFNLSVVFTFAMVTFFAVLALIFLYKIARDIFKLPAWASLAVALVFAFGCTSLSYAITLYQHLPTTFFIISSFYAVWKYKQGSSWLWALFVWINYALAISIDYPNAILMLPVMVYLFLVSFNFSSVEPLRARVSFRVASVITILGFAAISGLHMYHNSTYFGSWSRLSGSIPGLRGVVENKLLGSSKPDPSIAPAQTQKNVVGFFSENNMIQGFHILATSRDRGLLFYAPVFILGLVGLWSARKQFNLEYAVLVFLVATNVFLYSSWGDPWGGWAYGSRYLIPSMAVLSLFVGVFLAQIRYSMIRRFLFLLLFAYSSAIAFLGALTTNAVPPKIEAVALHAPYGYIFNWNLFLKSSRSGSFIYNTYVSGHLSLLAYALILYALLLIAMLIILYIIPRYENAD